MKIDLGVAGAIEVTLEIAKVFCRGHRQVEVILEAAGETKCPYLTWIVSAKTFLPGG